MAIRRQETGLSGGEVGLLLSVFGACLLLRACDDPGPASRPSRERPKYDSAAPRALGPLTAGFLLDAVSERATIAVFASFGLAFAVWGTLSSPIRAAPSLDELAELPAAEPVPAAVEGLEPRS